MKHTIAYNNRTNEELAAFAASRNLKVISTRSKRSNGAGPLRKDLFKALRDGDRDWTFRFLDLSAEMRNRVYEALLICRDSFTCWPEILATCKQVNKEASTILYGDNLIEVKCYKDGVYAHGRRCGTYSFRPHIWNGLASHHLFNLELPDFLSRAQFIRISFEDAATATAIKNGISLNNFFYAFCSALCGKHSLRSLELDIAVKKLYWPVELIPERDLRAAKLLGCLPQFILDSAAVSLSDMTEKSQTVSNLKNAMAASTFALEKGLGVMKAGLDSGSLIHGNERRMRELHTLLCDDCLALRGELHDGSLENITQCVGRLRKYTEAFCWSGGPCRDVVKALQQLFHHHVDLITAGETESHAASIDGIPSV